MKESSAAQVADMLRCEFARARNRLGDAGRTLHALREDARAMIALSEVGEFLESYAAGLIAPVDPPVVDPSQLPLLEGHEAGTSKTNPPRERSAIDAQIDGLTTSISALHSRAYALEGQLTEALASITHLHKRIDGTQTVCNDMRDRLESAENRLDAHATSIHTVATLAQEHETRFGLFAAAQKEHKDELASVQARMGTPVTRVPDPPAHVSKPGAQPGNTLLECPDAPTAATLDPGTIRFLGDAESFADDSAMTAQFLIPPPHTVRVMLLALHGPTFNEQDPSVRTPPHMTNIEIACTSRSLSVTATRSGIGTVLDSDRAMSALLRL